MIEAVTVAWAALGWAVCALIVALFVLLRVAWNRVSDARGTEEAALRRAHSAERRAVRAETELADLKQIVRERAARHGEAAGYRQAVHALDKTCGACGKRCLRCARYQIQTPRGVRVVGFDELLRHEQHDPFTMAEEIEAWIDGALEDRTEG